MHLPPPARPCPRLFRLHARHDDSEDNVLARLRLWDEHLTTLRGTYEDISLRLDATAPGCNDGTDPASAPLHEQAAGFLSLEAKVEEVEVVASHELTEMQYEIVDTMR